MRLEQKSKRLLGVVRAKAKMIEYNVPEQYQNIDLSTNPDRLFTITIGLLGDLAAAVNRGEPKQEALTILQNNLIFSAYFFDSYVNSKLNNALQLYTLLLGSASFYLCDLPGNASVLAKELARNIHGKPLNLDADGFEDLLFWLLQGDVGIPWVREFEEPFGKYIDGIYKSASLFYKDGIGEDSLIDLIAQLRSHVYEFGTPRQLLFADVIGAILRKKIENSAWKALPLYSGLSGDKWLHALQKKSFIKELWPAQHLLGKAGILKGKSAVVQMPTSAGKTKAIELIIRSAFLANRIMLAIINCPF